MGEQKDYGYLWIKFVSGLERKKKNYQTNHADNCLYSLLVQEQSSGIPVSATEIQLQAEKFFLKTSNWMGSLPLPKVDFGDGSRGVELLKYPSWVS